jgi:hypothetical protein
MVFAARLFLLFAIGGGAAFKCRDEKRDVIQTSIS